MLIINGVHVQFDDTQKRAVSLYGAGTAAGDTAVEVESITEPNVRVVLSKGGSVLPIGNTNADALAVQATAAQFTTAPRTFNETTFDRLRGNTESVVLASAARTAQTDSTDQTNYNGTGLIIVLDVSVDPATAAITPTLQLKDSISGNYKTIWTAAAAVQAVQTTTYLFCPGGAAGSYTEAVNLRIPRTWRLRMTVADADSMTYSVSAVTLV